jgi:predicted dehydrogenase
MIKNTRRHFIKATTLTGFGLSFGLSAKSYSRIIGANERINMATAGLNSRGKAHLSMAKNLGADKLNVAALVDVDSRVFSGAIADFPTVVSSSTPTFADYRKVLDNKDIDLLTIATPDHWHTYMAIEAMKAGKHVYLEKPCSHNPQEGEYLKAAEKKYGKKIQVGNQQRSAPTSALLEKLIKEGVIGNVYYAKAWYENNRKSIGKGQLATAPKELDWNLWQGPAPRKDYKDNWVHYNWHWFWHWGTGEIVNNGLHEIDVARRMLGAGTPTKVSSAGGRFAFADDWEFYDTQLASFEFAGGKLLNWEGRSCNKMDVHKRPGGRGVWLYGTNGTAVVDRAGFTIYDASNKIIQEESEKNSKNSADKLGITGMDNYHMDNLLDAIKTGVPLNSPVSEAVISTNMCHFGNMAQRLGKTLAINPATGRPNDSQAMSMWARKYEKGWEIKL